jgi:hypothetical protein
MKLAPNEPILASITERDVAFYLSQKGWKKAAYPRPELIVFDGPADTSGQPIKAIFPARRDLVDFQLRIQELVNNLGLIEHRDPLEIAQDILTPNVDRLRVRVLAEIAQAGTLPLLYATQLLAALKDLIVAAACTEDDPQPFYRKASAVGTDLANQMRFGQTERGSFVALIESHVTLPGQAILPGTPVPEPFSRRVIARVMRGVAKLEQALFAGNPQALNDSFRDGLNANMCEAILAMKPNLGEPQFEYRVSWAPILPAPQLPTSVRLERRTLDFIESTARTLRNAQESVERPIEGKVVKLSSLDPMDELEELADDRQVTIRFDLDARAQNVLVPLIYADYSRACDAHRDGKSIRITGRLERTGKQWRLSGPHDFQVLQ